MRKETAAMSGLSLSECLSLLYIGTTPDPKDLPTGDAAKLLNLGLAKVADGRFAYTPLGEEVAAWTARISDAPTDVIH